MKILGANAEGLTARYTDDDLTLIRELTYDKPFVIRFPGGSDAKNAYMGHGIPGLGMQADKINAFFDEYGKDENNEGREKDLKQLETDRLEDQSYLDDLIYIAQKVPSLKVIYNCNIFAEPSQNLYCIQYLLDGGVAIVGAVLGNELYFSLDYDGNKYVELFEPHAIAIREIFPDLPIGVCYAQDVQKNTHKGFNQTVENYIHTHPGLITAVDTHPYLADELSDALQIHPAFKGIGNPIAPIQYIKEKNYALEACFNRFNQIWSETSYYDNLFDTIEMHLPGIKIWISEFGCIPVDYWNNTIASAQFYFYVFLNYADRVQYFMLHNLIGNYHWAAIYNHIKHTSYYALQLAQELPDFYKWINDAPMEIESEGEHFFPYVNLGGQFVAAILADTNGLNYTVENTCCYAETNYATEGAAGFYLKKGAPGMLEPGMDVFMIDTFNAIIYQNSFGYLKVIATKKVVPGCTDPKATNYNAEATENDGSCTYAPKPSPKPKRDKKWWMFWRWFTETDNRKQGLRFICLLFFAAIGFISCSKEITQPKVISLAGSEEMALYGDFKKFDTIHVYHDGYRSEFISCDSMMPNWMYPSQSNDDYLHPERFWNPDSGLYLYHVVVIDHIATRKVQSIFIPNYNDSIAAVNEERALAGLPALPYITDLCGVDLRIKYGGTVVIFYDVYNWVDSEGRPLFNFNVETQAIFNHTVPLVVYTKFRYKQTSTGIDFNFGHTTLSAYYNFLF